MAEIDSGGGGGKKDGKKRSKKVSTKIDMTPMVDLAFLLITFFMLTTTFNKPQTMEINMPDKTENAEDDKMKVSEKRTLTVILGAEDKIYYYQGMKDQEPEVKITDYSDQGIRRVLLDKGREIKASEGKDAVILIKPLDKSRYKNMVDILDEMHITESKIYAIVEMTPEEKELILHQHPTATVD